MAAVHPPVRAAVLNGEYYQFEPTVMPLLEQGYHVTVVDNPFEDESQEAARDLAAEREEVELIVAHEQLTRGGLRNLILSSELVTDGTIINYVGAGHVMKSTGNIARLQDHFADETIGMVGGLILSANGKTQSMLNYGPNICGFGRAMKAYVDATVLMALEKYGELNKRRAAALRGRLGFMLDAWPNTFEPVPDEPKEVGYVEEANLTIRARDLRQTGRFPEYNLHEVQRVSRELERRGKKVIFDPAIRTTRLKDDSMKDMLRAHIVDGLPAAGRLAVRYTLPWNRLKIQ